MGAALVRVVCALLALPGPGARNAHVSCTASNAMQCFTGRVCVPQWQRQQGAQVASCIQGMRCWCSTFHACPRAARRCAGPPRSRTARSTAMYRCHVRRTAGGHYMHMLLVLLGTAWDCGRCPAHPELPAWAVCMGQEQWPCCIDAWRTSAYV
jgi:hypothetical protein